MGTTQKLMFPHGRALALPGMYSHADKHLGNTTQRNATQRDAAQRNATQYSLIKLHTDSSAH